MKRFPPFFTWLALAALADWLVTRTLARAAIFMPKSPVMLQAYQALGVGGQVASSLTGLLATLALGWIAWRLVRGRDDPALVVLCLGLILTGLLGLFISSGGWLALVFQALLCTSLLVLILRSWKGQRSLQMITGFTVTGLALMAGGLYQAIPAAYAVLGLAGPSPLSEVFYNAGELLVLLSVFALWLCFGSRAPWWAWLLAGVPALAFALGHLMAPAMTGVLAIWSTGLSLYLPWPLYMIGIWLAGVTVISTLRRSSPAGWALLLLAAGGYAPQLSVHAFLGLAALWLLANRLDPVDLRIKPEPLSEALARFLFSHSS